MTELSPVATMTPSSDEVLGSCGVLLPNTEAKVVDVTTGEPLGPEQHGEICIKGPQVVFKKCDPFRALAKHSNSRL